jgi:hypothetical protein
LRAAVRRARNDKTDLQEALALVEERWLAHTSAPKDLEAWPREVDLKLA